MEVPETIICVDCGQEARRLTPPPEEGWEIGDSVAYRCTGCNDRWDLVVSDPDSPATSVSYLDEFRALLDERATRDP
jgi:hypothetical protein